jgi:hypothetical protein
MGLSTDSIFIAAISSDNDIMAALGKTSKRPARLYSTAIPLPDEQADNVPVPFVIVTLDGLTNDETTKDDPLESNDDKVTIGITVTASNRNALADLTQAIRSTIHQYMMENETPVEDYAFSAEAVQYDSLKPCYWQTLVYQCDVNNLTDNDDEQD